MKSNQKWLRMALILVLMCAAGMGELTAQEQAKNAQGKFPELISENLEGRAMQLPKDFAGERNLLLIAFQRAQQKNVDTWLKQTKRFTDLDRDLRVYEIPTIEKMNRMMRWIINSGMRSGIHDQEARARTVTLYIDKKPFCDSLKISDEKQIYAMLVDKSGNVLWRASGDYDEKKGDSLQQALLSLRKPFTVSSVATPAN